MAAAFALLAGILLPCWSASAKFTKGSVKGNGVECSHHSECFSDCCLMNLDAKAAFCAPKTRINKTKGAINILCPCQMALSCRSKDEMCPHRCYLI
ncbi:colipase-like protein 2 isoform X3 [Manis pentadactyla]|uniref:colipase-like protein 2 isoform X3 n=1 Tax=Manis pentadactyla TaxID=143292 RepID=UPI00255D0E35|nr:colipase-like protein 2 isoform X3 [Manis pentadactyla]XP_057350249.1 colipase-like protein 2 isoform X3 [Manis pentadactyla]